MNHKCKLTVRAEVDFIGQFSDVHIEPVLHLIEDLGVTFLRHKGYGQALCTKPAGPRHPMQVSVGVFGHVIVEDNVHSLYVHATAEQVCCHQNTLPKKISMEISVVKLQVGY